MSLTFEWDPKKAESNLEKHGVSFEEAGTSFGDTVSVTIADPAHSEGELRFILIGLTATQRLVVVAHMERGDNVRIVNAGPATRKETRDYEQGATE
jgi:uncharacterized DUF497 family protein